MTATALDPAETRAGSGLRMRAIQPNFLPWLGFFAAAMQADVLVLLDDVPFSRGSYTNRVKVMGPTGPTWLTVPVAHPCSGVRIGDVRVPTGSYEATEAKLAARYGAPSRELVFDLFLQAPICEPSLAEANVVLIRALLRVLNLFDIRRSIVRASTLRSTPEPSTAGLIQLCRAVGASTYVAGNGTPYDDEAAYAAAGIEFTRARFRHPEYPQRRPAGMAFVPGLSVVDVIANCGTERTRELLAESIR